MTKPIPEGWHSVTPRLVVHDAAMLVEFLKQVVKDPCGNVWQIATHKEDV